MAYVDGFVVPVPKKNLAAYRRMAQGRQDLEGARRARVPRVRRRRRQGRQVHLVSAAA